jgi:hypothetical protein
MMIKKKIKVLEEVGVWTSVTLGLDALGDQDH